LIPERLDFGKVISIENAAYKLTETICRPKEKWYAFWRNCLGFGQSL